jgi:hypothetical protein
MQLVTKLLYIMLTVWIQNSYIFTQIFYVLMNMYVYIKNGLSDAFYL